MITKDDIGRRIFVTGNGSNGVEFTNKEGVIISVTSGYPSIGVEFDEKIKHGHDCFGECKDGHGFFVSDYMVTFSDGMDYALSSELDPYEALSEVLDDAYAQAESGKGKERHASNNKYEDQVICVVGRLLKDHPFGAHAYQVIKKTIEAGRLYKIKGPEAAYQEVLGAINYAAAMNILIKEGKEK